MGDIFRKKYSQKNFYDENKSSIIMFVERERERERESERGSEGKR